MYPDNDRDRLLAQEKDGIHDRLKEFVYGSPAERCIYAKGWGAFGHFKTLRSMSPYTRACIFQKEGQTVPVFTRFSFGIGNKGTPDTSRNIRGFSTKFYTKDGNLDLICSHLPVSVVNDPAKFPQAIRALSPSPISGLSSPENFWKFVQDNPETMHFVTWFYSDLGTLDNLRSMGTYSVNTYLWENQENQRFYVKYHWIPRDGIKTISREEAGILAGREPDIGGKDLHTTLAKGRPVEYHLCIQLMRPGQDQELPWDILDPTKLWNQEKFPLLLVGRLTLEKNPENYMEQVEPSAFSPANLIDGIALSNDPMLLAHASVCQDAQRRRIGPKYREIPVNRQSRACSIQNRKYAWELENSRWFSLKAQSTQRKDEAYFQQAGEHFQEMNPKERFRLTDNMAAELYKLPRELWKCILNYCYLADRNFGRLLEQRIVWYTETDIFHQSWP